MSAAVRLSAFVAVAAPLVFYCFYWVWTAPETVGPPSAAEVFAAAAGPPPGVTVRAWVEGLGGDGDPPAAGAPPVRLPAGSPVVLARRVEIDVPGRRLTVRTRPFPESYRFRITRDDGRALSDYEARVFDPRFRRDRGGPVVHHGFPSNFGTVLNGAFDLDRPGAYRVEFANLCQWTAEDGTSLGEDVGPFWLTFPPVTFVLTDEPVPDDAPAPNGSD